MSRNLQGILGSFVRIDGNFTETHEEGLTCHIEAHFPGFRAETEDINLNWDGHMDIE